MYYDDSEQHHIPHFHAKYQGHEASFDFDGNIIVGDFPASQKKYVVAWADIHKNELIALWEIMLEHGAHFKIKGLA